MTNPSEVVFLELMFKMAMAKFLDGFQGEGLREQTLARPLSHSTTLNENQPYRVIVVEHLDRFEKFWSQVSRN